MPRHTPATLLADLTQRGIAYTLHHHPPLFTVDEARRLGPKLPGAHLKNLFLKDKAGALTLLTALDDRRLNLPALAKHLGAKSRYSFGTAALLEATLGVTPGSVTPLALINTPPGLVQVVLDECIFTHAWVHPHPLVNTATLSLTPAALLSALQGWGHTPLRLDLGAFPTP